MPIAPWIRKSRAALPALAAGVATLFALRRLSDPDTWWHLASGRWIARHWAVPHTDTLSFTVPDHPWINVQWLFDLLLYGLQQAGGAPLLVLASAATWGLAIVLLVRNLRLAVGPVWTCIVTLWVATISWERFAARPEMLSFVLLQVVLWLFATRARRDGRNLWLLVPLMALWANTHALFVIGELVIVCHLAAAVATRMSVVPAGWRRATSESADTTKRVLAAGAVAVLATVANPYTVEGMLFPFKLMSRVSGSNPVFRGIGEFTPPFSSYFPELMASAYQLFFIFAVAVVVLAAVLAALPRRSAGRACQGTVDRRDRSLDTAAEKMRPTRDERTRALNVSVRSPRVAAFSWRRIEGRLASDGALFDPASLLAFCALAYLSLLARRNMALFAFGTAPFVAQCVFMVQRRLPPILPRVRSTGALALAAVLPALLLAAAWFVASNGFYRWDQDIQECGTGILDVSFPIRAAAFAKQMRLPPRLYNDMNSGGYLSWAHPVEGGVYIDGRLEVYDAAFFSAYAAALLDPPLWQRDADRMGIGTVVLFHAWPNRHRLIRWLLQRPEWALVYFDEVAIVFVRRAGNAERIAAAQQAFPALRDATERRLLGPVSSWQWPAARAEGLSNYGQLLNLMGRPAESVKFYERLLSLRPPAATDAAVRAWLAKYHARQGGR
jgi:hypothetical protein